MSSKKAVKMPLAEFLGPDSTGSWADEYDASLPSGPSSQYDEPSGGYSDNSYSGPGRSSYNNRDRSRDSKPFTRNNRYEDRPQRNVSLPTEPPFTAFLGNLAFDVTQEDIADFFGPENVSIIRIVKDKETQRPKGHAYVEFTDLEALKAALEQSNQDLRGRNVRIDIAEPKRQAQPTQRADAASTWRREGPVESPRDNTRRAPSGRGGFGGERNFRGDRGYGGERSYGGDRNSGGDRQYGRERNNGGERSFGGDRGFRGERNYNRRPDYQPRQYGDKDGKDLREDRPAPSERPKLQLAPRTKPLDATPAPASSTAKKSNPFGSAKPVDTTKVLLQVEAKLESTRITDENPEEEQ